MVYIFGFLCWAVAHEQLVQFHFEDAQKLYKVGRIHELEHIQMFHRHSNAQCPCARFVGPQMTSNSLYLTHLYEKVKRIL